MKSKLKDEILSRTSQESKDRVNALAERLLNNSKNMTTDQLKPFVEKAIKTVMDRVDGDYGDDCLQGEELCADVYINGVGVSFDLTYEYEYTRHQDRPATHLEPAEYSVRGHFQVTSMEYFDDDDELIEVPIELWEGERSWE